MLIQAFRPHLFCFPLGYSFGAVYAAVAACLFLRLVFHGCSRSSSVWIVLAALAAAIAFLAKPEVGAGCFAALVLFIGCRILKEQTFRRLRNDVLALLPGAALCVAVIAWMISLRGPE